MIIRRLAVSRYLINVPVKEAVDQLKLLPARSTSRIWPLTVSVTLLVMPAALPLPPTPTSVCVPSKARVFPSRQSEPPVRKNANKSPQRRRRFAPAPPTYEYEHPAVFDPIVQAAIWVGAKEHPVPTTGTVCETA